MGTRLKRDGAATLENEQTVPVSERALAARINRALAKQGQTLRRCRADSRWHRELGDYYAIDVDRNTCADTDIDLEALGREMGVLREFEKLADELEHAKGGEQHGR
jgi:hypothetical protein